MLPLPAEESGLQKRGRQTGLVPDRYFTTFEAKYSPSEFKVLVSALGGVVHRPDQTLPGRHCQVWEAKQDLAFNNKFSQAGSSY